MIDTLEVVDHITADCIEVGDVISIGYIDSNEEADIITVETFDDEGSIITVTGYSEVSGDRESYSFRPDEHVALLAEPVEDID